MRNFFLGIKYAVKKEVGGGCSHGEVCIWYGERKKKKKFLRKKEKEKVKKSWKGEKIVVLAGTW